MMALKYFSAILIAALLVSCSSKMTEKSENDALNRISSDYVRLALNIGQYDTDFVDAYYGPDSLKPAAPKRADFPKDSFIMQAAGLKKELDSLAAASKNDSTSKRAKWLSAQLTAFERRIKVFSGENVSFDEESRELFDAVAPVYPEKHFQSQIARLDSLLPGKGSISDRFQKLAGNFLIPEDKIDTVFRTAIAEARRRTLTHYELPAGETFTLEYVRDKPWSGYNWYKGNFTSVIQINVSQPIFIERAIDLACHEGYPGHHVYNSLLEKNLYKDKNRTEISLYPLFSPQSLIAEGSANYGISVAFPGNEQKEFCKKVLMPLAEMDTSKADLYFEALSVKSGLGYVRNEAARGILNKTMTDEQAIQWLENYALLTPKGAADYLKFIKKYRSYVINYNYGQDLVKNYIEAKGGTDNAPERRWKLFGDLLSNEIKASDLQIKQ
ncbi:hypothetical protein [Dyadobacter flavalbus]|nr:hypothetical protein [Dyadobacter flavalbus]